jgi:hypothetical protein
MDNIVVQLSYFTVMMFFNHEELYFTREATLSGANIRQSYPCA